MNMFYLVSNEVSIPCPILTDRQLSSFERHVSDDLNFSRVAG